MRNIHTTKEPVTLIGYQAVMKPSQYGYSLRAEVGQDLIDALEEERVECLKWAESKLTKPKNRCVLRPEPWEEIAEGKYMIKFSWSEEKKPPIVDTEGTPISDTNTPVYEGSLVKIGFVQKPYLLKDNVTYGTSLKISGLQVVSVKGSAGVDSGDLDETSAAELFGKCKGYKTEAPNPVPVAPLSDDDF